MKESTVFKLINHPSLGPNGEIHIADKEILGPGGSSTANGSVSGVYGSVSGVHENITSSMKMN